MQQSHTDLDAQARQMATALQTSCVGVRVGRLNRIVGRYFDQALRPLGLTVAQLEVLGTLTLADEPPRPTDLAEWLVVERSTMSRNLALLESRGFTRVAELSPTGRSRRVAITADGRKALANAKTAWQAAQQAVADRMGADVVPTLDSWLQTLVD